MFALLKKSSSQLEKKYYFPVTFPAECHFQRKVLPNEILSFHFAATTVLPTMRRSPKASVSLTSLKGARRREGVGQVMGQVGAGSVLPPAVYRQVERNQQERHIGPYTTRRVSASLCAYE